MKKLLLLFFLMLLGVASFVGCIAPNDGDGDDGDDDDNEDEGVEDGDGDDEDTVTIKLQTPDGHCRVVGDYQKIVKIGENVTFSVVFDEYYVFDTISSGAEYSNGTVTISNCDKDQNYKIYSKSIDDLYLFLVDDSADNHGRITANKTLNSEHPVNTQITVTASPNPGETFLGWTVGGSLSDGKNPVSTNLTYSFALRGTTMLYANYLTDDIGVIRYHLNGGYLQNDSEAEIYVQIFNSTVRLCPNLSTNRFYREGYELLEYTTNQDGSGEAINLGGLAKIPDSGILDVYLQWIQETPASHFTWRNASTSGNVIITGYTGNDDAVVIPKMIDGKSVCSIASGAFNSKSFRTLVIPSSITEMENGAFKNCNSFDTLYISDNFTGIYDTAFNNCKKFSKLCINAIVPAVFSQAENVATRLETIFTRDESKNMIIFVAGSSVLHGVKGYVIDEGLDNKYQILNMGTNAGCPGMLYIEAISKFLKPGDIIVNAPEYSQNQMAGTALNAVTFRATEACYNIYRYVDFSKYSGFFDAMSEFNTNERYRGGKLTSGKGYNVANSQLTRGYCDYSKNTVNNGTEYNSSYFTDAVLSPAKIEEKAPFINALYQKLTALGIKYYYSFAPICSDANLPDSRLTAYEEKCREVLLCPVISNILNYKFVSNNYFDSYYHLNTAAAEIRSQRLLADLIARFEAEAD